MGDMGARSSLVVADTTTPRITPHEHAQHVCQVRSRRHRCHRRPVLGRIDRRCGSASIRTDRRYIVDIRDRDGDRLHAGVGTVADRDIDQVSVVGVAVGRGEYIGCRDEAQGATGAVDGKFGLISAACMSY